MKRKNKIKIPRYVNGGLLSNVDLNKLTVGAQLAGTGMQAAGGAVGDLDILAVLVRRDGENFLLIAGEREQHMFRVCI